MSEIKDTMIPQVHLSDLEKLIGKVKKELNSEDVGISFEFIVASLFPTSWNNIQSALSHQYTLGYIQGRKDIEKEICNSSIEEDFESCYE